MKTKELVLVHYRAPDFLGVEGALQKDCFPKVMIEELQRLWPLSLSI